MPDKLTDSEIKKALEHEIEIAKIIGDNTAYIVEMSVLINALDLINRLQAKIIKEQNYADCLNAENERLTNCRKEEVEKLTAAIDKVISEAKAEAYKECIEKVKTEIDEALKNNYKVRSERAQSIPIYTEDEFWNYCAGKIDCLRGLDDFCDSLLKELVGEGG